MNPGQETPVGAGRGMNRWNLPCDPLSALQRGDGAPFEEFVRNHSRTLIAFFRQLGAPPSRAEDLSQEVFLKLFQGASRYRAEERFASFFFRVARNVWIDECRRGGVRPEAGPLGFLDTNPDPPGERIEPEANLVVEEQEASVRRLLENLPEAHRRVFELAVLGELGYAEIGALLDIPVGTVKSRMFYAVRRLRLLWAAAGGKEGVA